MEPGSNSFRLTTKYMFLPPAWLICHTMMHVYMYMCMCHTCVLCMKVWIYTGSVSFYPISTLKSFTVFIFPKWFLIWKVTIYIRVMCLKTRLWVEMSGKRPIMRLKCGCLCHEALRLICGFHAAWRMCTGLSVQRLYHRFHFFCTVILLPGNMSCD